MVISSHDMDQVANISQEYIEHLKTAEQKALADRAIAQHELDAAAAAFNEVNKWEENIAGYWTRVKATEKKYLEIEDLINTFKNTAAAVVQNTYCVAEASEILACMVRQMTTQTDSLKQKMRTILDQVASVAPTNPFRPFMDAYVAAVEEAITANAEAIRKTLDVLKAAYLLHISIKGKRRLHEHDVRFHLDPQYRTIDLETPPSIEILPFLDRDRGVESNLENLLYILSRGHAFPVEEDNKSLCAAPLPGEIVTHFPLCDSPDGYFQHTRNQNHEAQNRLENATWVVREKQNRYDLHNAKYAGIQRSLAASLDAKKKTN